MVNPKIRSLILAMLGGMMAAAYLHSEGIVDLSYGFEMGSLAEGALMAITGMAAGAVFLLAYRLLRYLATRGRE